MADDLPDTRLRAGDGDRDAALEVLRQAHAHGRLSLEELQHRQEAALRAVYTDELPALLADLPESDALEGRPVAPRTPPVPVVPNGQARWSAAVMSGRTVHLEPGSPGMNSFAFWGGDDIYLRDALGPGVTLTLNLHAIMAGSDIYVPRGVRVIDEPLAIMAGNDIAPEAQGDGSNGTVILKGILFWGGHDVKLDKRGQ